MLIAPWLLLEKSVCLYFTLRRQQNSYTGQARQNHPNPMQVMRLQIVCCSVDKKPFMQKFRTVHHCQQLARTEELI